MFCRLTKWISGFTGGTSHKIQCFPRIFRILKTLGSQKPTVGSTYINSTPRELKASMKLVWKPYSKFERSSFLSQLIHEIPWGFSIGFGLSFNQDMSDSDLEDEVWLTFCWWRSWPGQSKWLWVWPPRGCWWGRRVSGHCFCRWGCEQPADCAALVNSI